MTTAVDPLWIAKISNDKGGEDFLGLRSVQAAMTGYLLPGIITITPRARYYAFYCWVLFEYAQGHPEGWSLRQFMRRREQIFALANIAYADSSQGDSSVAGLAGSDKLSIQWRESKEQGSIPLDTEHVQSYLGAPYGGYDAYRGVMTSLQLITALSDGRNAIGLLPKGRQLGQAFADSINDTQYYRSRQEIDTEPSVSVDILEEYGSKASLDLLSVSKDRDPLLDVLFAFDAGTQQELSLDEYPDIANMHCTLGMILEMHHIAGMRLSEDQYRHRIAYCLTDDYPDYVPTEHLRTYASYWQLFQMREYYVYALYALWRYFLRWLRHYGPQSLDVFDAHVASTLDFGQIASQLGTELPKSTVAELRLDDFLNSLLDQAGVPPGNLPDRAVLFSKKSASPLSEYVLHRVLEEISPDSGDYLSATWLLFSTLFLRLSGIQASTREDVWCWASAGDVKRRSMKQFVQTYRQFTVSGATVHDALAHFLRDYIIAQHTLVSLEKWRERGANTFHFSYDGEFFDWIHDGATGFSASRFRQAKDMLEDLGLFEANDGSSELRLSELGVATLARAVEACGARG